MRWSLILSAFIAVQSTFSLFCVALVLQPSKELERRAPTKGAKISSKDYRKNSEQHAYVYKFNPSGGVTREMLEPEERVINGKKLLIVPHTDADHVFELQMLENHLKSHNLEFEALPHDLQRKVKDIINGPKNVVPIPASVNRGKGQLTKHGLEGKNIAPNESRDRYALLSYTTARNTAQSLDKAFKQHGYKFGGKTLHNKLRNTMDNAKILKPGEPSPAGSSMSSDAGSSKNGLRRSGRTYVANRAKPKFVRPTRKSARIAGRGKK